MKALLYDPRHIQIMILSGLLMFLMVVSDFAPGWRTVVTAVSIACLVQAGLLFVNFFRFLPQGEGRMADGRCHVLKGIDLRSPLITALSLCLLLKGASIWVFGLAAFLAIGSKFLLRLDNKHIFNPSNFAIVVLLLVLPGQVWVSPGQWGSAVWFGFFLACAAFAVLSRSQRMDVAVFFLGVWAALIFGRAVWLGDPFSIPLHQMQSGALLIFAFFMISDPKTTPDHRTGRFVFALAVAVLAYILQFGFQVRESLFYALFSVCLLTPMLDTIFKAQRYQWRNT